jgi:hypothetical protein
MRYFMGVALLTVLLETSGRAMDSLAEISREVEGQARRASSGLFDPESNQDASHVAAGETMTLTTLRGPGEIRHMWFTIAGHDRRYPRTLVLRIFWDGATVPSVETPIGDFFAAGNGMRANVNSLPIQTTSYGRALNCYWRMPFRQQARIEVTNEGPTPLTVYWQFDWMELPRAPDKMLYFHARYRQEFPAKPFSPYVIFEGQGAGHYVGTVFSIQCSYGSWFGESDDRFYIDGESEPSIVGTGCEDFFNDAWNLRLFSNANTGVTIKEPNGEDCRFTAYRWHIQAPVTFRKSLKVEIERRSFAAVTDPATGQSVTHDFKYRPDFCSSVAFWYQSNTAAAAEPLPPAAARINPEVVIEPAEITAEIKTAPDIRAERRSNRVCNLKQALFVDNPGIGGWIEIPGHIEEAGAYSISVFQCLFRTGGVWKLTLKTADGERVLDPGMDFYDPYLAWQENRPENFLYGTWFENKVGIHRLPQGDCVFRWECVGAHPLARAANAAGPGFDMRLDGISLRKFPWDNLPAQMQQYLADEERLFAEREAKAQQTVATLDQAIRRYRTDTGEFPRDLAELRERPARIARQVGHWPYLAQVSADPWGQTYRYDVPGRFNPDTFDVYSVHGNSRDPSLWIGNWPIPYRWQDALEGEDLSVQSNSEQVTVVKQKVDATLVPPISRGQLLFVKLRRAGDFIQLAFPAPAGPGRHDVRLRLVTSWDYATVNVLVNGVPVAKSMDTYSRRIGTKLIDLGKLDLLPQGNTLRLEAVERNPASTGYCVGIDALVAVPAP